MKSLHDILTKIWNDDRQSDFSNPFCSLLYTCSLIYGGVVRSRNFFYDAGIFETKELPCPVIGVGNITVGGTGKTPTAILLANLLRDRGKKPAVLSRGYGGKGGTKVNIVSDGERTFQEPEEAGDEPILIAGSVRGVPVLTGPDRYLVGQQAIARFGADVLVLDDAFQHRRLFRDINILLLDAERPFGNGLLIPRGALREPRSALSRADVMILTRSDETLGESSHQHQLEVEFPGTPVFSARHRPTGMIRIGSEESCRPDHLAGRRVFAFAGIARPESFRKTIEGLGGEIAAFRAFPDHHRYSKADLESIIETAREREAEIILTTEKDGIKLPGLGVPLPGVYMLRVEMEIAPEREKFENAILARLTA